MPLNLMDDMVVDIIEDGSVSRNVICPNCRSKDVSVTLTTKFGIAHCNFCGTDIKLY